MLRKVRLMLYKFFGTVFGKRDKLIKNGNKKLGEGNIGTVSKLAGNQIYSYTDKGIEKEISGSCGKFCEECGSREKGCYVFKSYRYKSVVLGHARTTSAFRENIVKAFADMDIQLTRKRKKFEIVRINQSGELESRIEFDLYKELAKAHPETHFYLYTKAFEYVIPSLLENGLPENMTVLCSIWHEYGINEYLQVAHIEGVKAFIYDDGSFDYKQYGIETETYCHAYKEETCKNGNKKAVLNKDITCNKCRKCFNRIYKVIGTIPH